MTTYRGLALSGKMRSGKDSSAQALNRLDPRFIRVGFADELKRMAQKETGLDYFVEETKIKHRAFLIALGQAYRTYDKDFWVNKLLANLRPGTFPIITDLRFKNEAKALKDAGFLLIRLNPSMDTIKARGGKALEDISETDLDDYKGFDGYIDTAINSPDVVAQKLMVMFGSIAREELFGQKFRVGDRVKIIGGLYTKEKLVGTVLDVQKNPQRMINGPLNPMLTVRLDTPFGGRQAYDMRPNQIEMAQ